MLKGDIVKTGLKVDHTHPPSALQLLAIMASVHHLVLVFRRLLVDRDDVLHHPICLARLLAWYQQEWGDTSGVFMREDRRDNPFSS